MLSLLLFLTLGCGDGDPPAPPSPSGAALPFDDPGATPTRRLDASSAKLELPLRGVPEIPTTFTLSKFEADPHSEGCHVAAVPFTTRRSQERIQPDGMTVTADGQTIPYVVWAHGRGPGWLVREGTLHIFGVDKPTAVRIEHPNLARRLERFELEPSGMEPADFARFQYTEGNATRNGLLLPAPAVASWEAEIQPGQYFEASTAIATPPGLPRTSDGLSAVLRFRDEQGVVELARREIRPPGMLTRTAKSLGMPDEGPFLDWRVALEPVSGRSGRLELVSEPLGREEMDYLFVGHPSIVSTPRTPPRRVIVIGLDTMRPDHLGLYGYARDTSAEIDAFAERAAVFEKAWTPAPRTRPSFRSATTGRHPLTAVGATNISEVFAANGFATAGFVANVHLSPRFQFTRGFDLWRLDPKALATEQVDLAINWLKENAHRDAYLFLHLMDPHLFYKPPEAFAAPFLENPDPTLPPRFNLSSVAEMEHRGELTPQRKAHIEALYDGEVAYMSHEMARLFETLEELGGNDLVVIHSDHGEEFWEHGGFEHNHTLYDEVTRAVLLVRPPGGTPTPVRSPTPATLADIAPTLYDYLGFKELPETDGESLRRAVEGDPMDSMIDRPIGTAHRMYDVEQWGVIYKGHKYTLVTGTGAEQLFDLDADPGELENLAGKVDMEPWRQALSRAHLGMEVGHGFRVQFQLTKPIEILFPSPVADAGLIEPEALRKRRANQAWGEPPEARPGDVATVTLNEERTRLLLQPHGKKGTVWVRFAERFPTTDLTVTRGGSPLKTRDLRGRLQWRAAGEVADILPGIVVNPPEGEGSRIARLGGDETLEDGGSAEDMELLRELGYVGDEEP